MLETSAWTSALKLPTVTFCAVGPITLDAVSVPVTVPLGTGQVDVPTGGFGRFEQKNTMIPPGTCSLPK